MARGKEYVLKYPFKGIDGEMVKTVALRRVTAGDMMELADDDSSMTQMAQVLANTAGLALDEEVRKMDIVDFEALQEELAKQRPGVKTGK